MNTRCKHLGICGGCQLQHLPYEEQLERKRTFLKEKLTPLGNHNTKDAINIIGMDRPWRYRNKMECTFGPASPNAKRGESGDGGAILGFHKRGSFYKLVDIDECWLVPSIFENILKTAKALVNKIGLSTYHPKTHQGFWRHLILRYGRERDEVMVICITNGGLKEPVEELCKGLSASFASHIKSFYWGITSRVADVAVPQELFLLSGNPYINERIDSIALHIYPMNFVQPNIEQAQRIYEQIKTIIDSQTEQSMCSYDLYCGIGIIAMLISSNCNRVYGVDSDRHNISCANENVSLNKGANIQFLCGKTEDIVRSSDKLINNKPDTIILDPPRAGVHKNIFAYINQSLPKRLLYLSCNPDTLVRDLRIILKSCRYRITLLKGWDMFPHTSHIETLALLERV